MNNKICRIEYIVLVIALSASFISAQHNKLQYNEWITDWYLLGPIALEGSRNEEVHLGGFENDILVEHGGIANPQIEIGQVETFGNSTATWIEYSSPDYIINLDEVISEKPYVAAYAYKEIYVEDEGMFTLSLGTNDGGKLWVNGVEVWDYVAISRGAAISR